MSLPLSQACQLRASQIKESPVFPINQEGPGFGFISSMLRLIICLLMAIQVLNTNAQPCADTAKKINYSSPGYQFNLQQHLVSVTDEVYLSGNYFNMADSGIFHMKINPDGTVATSQKIHSPYIPGNNSVTGFLELQNGNVLLTIGGVAAANGGTGEPTFKLIWLNPSGNIIRAKEYTDLNNSKMAVKAIKESSGNSFIIMLNYIDGNPAHAQDFGTAFIKIDASGNIQWSRYFSTLPNNTLEGIGLAVLDDKIYCVGTKRYGADFFLGFPDYEDNLWAAKIDVNSGHLINSKSYLDLRIQNSQNSILVLSYIFGNLSYSGNGQFIYTDRHRASGVSGYARGMKKSLMDTNLVFSQGSFFNYTNKPIIAERILATARNEVILYCDSSTSTGSPLTRTYISMYDSQNNPVREMQIKYPAGSGFRTVGWKPIGSKNKYISLINSYMVAGDTYLQLYQMPNDIALSPCYGSDTSIVKLQPYPITELSPPFILEARPVSLSLTDFSVTSSVLPLTASADCIVQSACSILSVSGPSSICNTNGIYTFTARKDGNCLKHVLWKIDTSAVQSTQQLNDTTFNIQFKKTWQGFLYASINSCGPLKDSIWINVFKTPSAIYLGRDTVLCKTTAWVLNAGSGFKNYYWQNGSTDSMFTVTQSGIYHVTATDYCGNLFTDTITVTVNIPAAIRLGNDTSICINRPLTLNAGTGFIQYLWNTGNTTQYQTISGAGAYSVMATNSFGCVARDTINILNTYPAPFISLNKNPVLCLHQNNRLSAGGGLSSYLWQNGSTDSAITISQPGLYRVTVSNNFGCFSSDSVHIKRIAIPPKNFLNNDTAICSYETAMLSPRFPYNQYLWNTGSVQSAITVSPPSITWLQVIDSNNCRGIDTVSILAKDCPDYIYIPTAFTPNYDGKNDLFSPIVSGRIEQYQFSVYNRYGQLVYRSTIPGKGWNGQLKGILQDPGVFVWVCSYKFKNQDARLKKGTVELIR